MSLLRIFPNRKFLKPLLVVGAILIGILFGIIFSLYNDLPSLHALKNYRPDIVTVVLDRNGNRIAEIYQQKRIWVEYRDIPEVMINAIIAIEDRNFFKHEGISFIAILRAALYDIKSMRFAQGGSTITQQLAKLLFLTPEKSLSRKIKEALLAIEIERNITKEEILEIYFNQIYIGEGAYGIESGARLYFNKSISQINLEEAATLAAIPNAPAIYSPLANYDLAIKRRNLVLACMRREGFISSKEENNANSKPITLYTKPQEDESYRQPRYFVSMIKQYIAQKYGDDILYKGGLTIRTTLDRDLQAAAVKSIRTGFERITKLIPSLTIDDDNQLQGALIALRVSDGSIAAIVGGRDYNLTQFNRATMAVRQTGSVFKPIVYLTALEEGIAPTDIIIDSPLIYNLAKNKTWKPKNYDGKFHGKVSVRTALEKSLNVATIKLLRQVGIDKVIAKARKLGISSKLDNNLTLGLGSASVSLIEMSSAYQAIANGGLHAKPYFIQAIYDSSDNELDNNRPSISVAATEQASFILTNLLTGVIRNGTGKVALSLKREVAGKTGTTSNYKDSWFVGYSPSIVTGVWVGFDNNRSLGKSGTGSQFAGHIWTNFMQKILADQPNEKFIEPNNIVTRIIDLKSGRLASFGCGEFYTEKFIVGTQPTEHCNDQRNDGTRL